MSKRVSSGSRPDRRDQRGVFILTTVALLMLVAALILLGAYHWAMVDWEVAMKSMPH